MADIKFIDVVRHYKQLNHQDRALIELEAKLRNIAPHLLEEFQDTWRREPKPELADKPRLNRGTIELPHGRVGLSDAIIAGGNFTWAEALHDGQRIPGDRATVGNIIAIAKKLQIYRDKLGTPFRITSWYRPEPWNSRAGGARFSTHLNGLAVDAIMQGMSGIEARAAIAPTWEGGLGTYRHYPDIIHLDAGANRRW